MWLECMDLKNVLIYFEDEFRSNIPNNNLTRINRTAVMISDVVATKSMDKDIFVVVYHIKSNYIVVLLFGSLDRVE